MSDTAKLNHCPRCGAPIPAEAPQGLCPKCVLLGATAPTDTGGAAATTSELPSLQRVSTAFPHLEVIELIGRGGMGFVYKARQPHLDRFVALKLLPDKLARDPRFAERFNREGRVLARMNHPNIVSVYDFGQSEHFYFLVMEYVDGVNLRQAMKAGRFSPGEALAIVPKICEALQYAHGQGILHRDIKPENILLDARGQIKIADFGIAKLVGDETPDVTLTATGAALGTPHYMAPEQLEKPSEVDHRADIYSLGVVFYEMLTGELPIGRFAAPSSKTPVSASVDEVVFRTLEKDRERRYQSAGEMKMQVEDLTNAGTAGPPAGAPASGGVGAGRVGEAPKWSNKAIWAAVLTGLSLPLLPVLAAVVYWVNGRDGGWFPLAAAMASLPALAGTSLGWMALGDLRVHRGRLRGLALAVFAALAWPLLLLLGAMPVFLWMMAGSSMKPLGVAVMLLVPLGTMAFALWAVYATIRWSHNKTPSHRRGVLKWVFVVLFLSAVSYVLVLVPVRRRVPPPATNPEEATAPAFDATAPAPGAGTSPPKAVGRLKLLAVRHYHNLVLARVESLPGNPLHQLVARFAGPELSEPVTRARGVITPPLLVPAPDEDMNKAAEPADGSASTNQPPVASAISFESPGDHVLAFVLPDETVARDAARQVQEVFGTASSLALTPGRPTLLFTAGEWKGWMEARPFQANQERFVFFRHPGHSPARVPGTNTIDAAVATIPAGHELRLTGRLVINGVNHPEPAFSATLYSGANEPGMYWFTWYSLPNPQKLDDAPKESWELLVQDMSGSELFRAQAPNIPEPAWQRRWPEESKSARWGTPISQVLFHQKQTLPSERGPTFVLLEMVMHPSTQVERRP